MSSNTTSFFLASIVTSKRFQPAQIARRQPCPTDGRGSPPNIGNLTRCSTNHRRDLYGSLLRFKPRDRAPLWVEFCAHRNVHARRAVLDVSLVPGKTDHLLYGLVFQAFSTKKKVAECQASWILLKLFWLLKRILDENRPIHARDGVRYLHKSLIHLASKFF